MFNLITESRFEKDFQRCKKRGKDLKKLQQIIDNLLHSTPLPIKNRNHKLHGNYNGYWECHIEPDWLLIYKKTAHDIILARTGTHSDLFK